MRALFLHYPLYFHSKFVRHLSARKRKNGTLLYRLFSLRMESSKSIQIISTRNNLCDCGRNPGVWPKCGNTNVRLSLTNIKRLNHVFETL